MSDQVTYDVPFLRLHRVTDKKTIFLWEGKQIGFTRTTHGFTTFVEGFDYHYTMMLRDNELSMHWYDQPRWEYGPD